LFAARAPRTLRDDEHRLHDLLCAEWVQCTGPASAIALGSRVDEVGGRCSKQMPGELSCIPLHKMHTTRCGDQIAELVHLEGEHDIFHGLISETAFGNPSKVSRHLSGLQGGLAL